MTRPNSPTVVLDTSALLADPSQVAQLDGRAVVVPATVVAELGRAQGAANGTGRAARAALDSIVASLRRSTSGALAVQVAGGAEESSVDVAQALGARGVEVVLVTADPAVRIRASQAGVAVRGHTGPADQPGPGWHVVDAPSQVVNQLHRDKASQVNGLPVDLSGVAENEFCELRSGSQTVKVRLARGLLRVVPRDVAVWNLKARSIEQAFALDLLCDQKVSIVAVAGAAGTGKTIAAVAAGLAMVVNRDVYGQLTLYRPQVALDPAQLGYVPGGHDGQVDPWRDAVLDTITALTEDRSYAKAGEHVDEWTAGGVLRLESVALLRGRSLHRQFVIVDEAQNLSGADAKAILSRAGEGTKVVFVGDVDAIDVPYLSRHTNALAVLRSRLRGQPEFGSMTLTRGSRSRAAELASLHL